MTQWKPKQLEWEEVGENKLSAKVGGFPCFYNYNPNVQTSNAILHEGISSVAIGNFGSFDEAKAACQADFERRWQDMGEQSEREPSIADLYFDALKYRDPKEQITRFINSSNVRDRLKCEFADYCCRHADYYKYDLNHSQYEHMDNLIVLHKGQERAKLVQEYLMEILNTISGEYRAKTLDRALWSQCEFIQGLYKKELGV